MAAEGCHGLQEDRVEAHVEEVRLSEEAERKPVCGQHQLTLMDISRSGGSLTYPPNPLDLEYSWFVPC